MGGIDMAQNITKDKILSLMSEAQIQAARAKRGGGFSGQHSKRTKRRQELLAEQERHAMDKPKELKDQTDGDLLEVKKDPEETKKAWEVWLEKKDKTPKEKEQEMLKRMNEKVESYTPEEAAEKLEALLQHIANTGKKRLDKETKEENKSYVTKPIPDSKGGRGSFQHCINANKDKKNPGGWCKQIERKIGKGLGALGEGKLNRKTGKPMKLKPRKITLDEFESENQIDEKARKKREPKEAADYFVEEIRANIIYHNKIFPLVGMIAGSVARGVGAGAKKVGGELLDGMGDMAKEQSEEER